MYNPYIST